MSASQINCAGRTDHLPAVKAFLESQFSCRTWEFRLPPGWGNETYYVNGCGKSLFVKLGAPVANYQAMAALDLAPPILAAGTLDDGTSILVQPLLEGKEPSWSDFRLHLEQMAEMVRTMQQSQEIRRVLPEAASEKYRSLGLETHRCVRQRWEQCKGYVPSVAGWVDESLDQLAGELDTLDGSGVVVAHNDLCNANWMLTTGGKIYLLDLDAMSLDDPAQDLGTVLWWYYPAEIRGHFLEITGYPYDESVRQRMRLRMALHCLHILLPRERSFDKFDANIFINSLDDFKAILAGRENPRGYADE